MSAPAAKLVILGSTGSIGESALRVAASLPGRLRVVGLAAQYRAERLIEQAVQFQVPRVALADPAAAERAARLAPPGLTVTGGPDALEALALEAAADIALVALVGIAGLKPVLAALGRGIDVALATKEVLVAAGPMVLAAVRRGGARLLPVDSEHNAIFQCLAGRPPDHVRRLILTASGGPFARDRSIDLDRVSVAEALQHPRWRMGRKISIDSATMMNKGLEIIEARWLFGIPLDRIDVVLHPESIVHSLVEFRDGGLLAQMSASDMRYAIQSALTWPDCLDGGLPPLDLAQLGALHFGKPDEARFPCLPLARAAAQTGGTMPAVLNAANEVAVQAFLAGHLSFPGIWRTVEATLNGHRAAPEPNLQAVVEADRWARAEARARIASAAGTSL